MVGREVPVSQDVLGGLHEQRRGLREARPQPVRDLVELRQRRRMLGLGEDGPDEGGDGLLCSTAVARSLRHLVGAPPLSPSA
jgi:hypothetical protein